MPGGRCSRSTWSCVAPASALRLIEVVRADVQDPARPTIQRRLHVHRPAGGWREHDVGVAGVEPQLEHGVRAGDDALALRFDQVPPSPTWFSCTCGGQHVRVRVGIGRPRLDVRRGAVVAEVDLRRRRPRRSARSPGSAPMVAGRLAEQRRGSRPRSSRSRPRRTRRSGRGRRGRSGTRPASTGCPTPSRSRGRCRPPPGSGCRCARSPAGCSGTTCSNANSGECTPTIVRPAARYRASHAVTCGSVRRQLMHEYVQKSISTTRPRRPASVSGVPPGVSSQAEMPVNSGAGPKSRRFPPGIAPGADRAGRGRAPGRCLQVVDLPLHRVRALHLLQHVGVAGRGRGERVGDAGGEQHRRRHQDGAGDAADGGRVRAEGAEPLRGALAEQCHAEQRQRGPDGVGERQQQRLGRRPGAAPPAPSRHRGSGPRTAPTRRRGRRRSRGRRGSRRRCRRWLPAIALQGLERPAGELAERGEEEQRGRPAPAPRCRGSGRDPAAGRGRREAARRAASPART